MPPVHQTHSLARRTACRNGRATSPRLPSTIANPATMPLSGIAVPSGGGPLSATPGEREFGDKPGEQQKPRQQPEQPYPPDALEQLPAGGFEPAGQAAIQRMAQFV